MNSPYFSFADAQWAGERGRKIRSGSEEIEHTSSMNHMLLRVVHLPKQPSQPAESALCQEEHSGFARI